MYDVRCLPFSSNFACALLVEYYCFFASEKPALLREELAVLLILVQYNFVCLFCFHLFCFAATSGLASTIALVGVIIVAYGALGVQLYAGAYDVAGEDIRRNFDNAFDAVVAMTVLITTENFPDVFRPALGGGGGHGLNILSLFTSTGDSDF